MRRDRRGTRAADGDRRTAPQCWPHWPSRARQRPDEPQAMNATRYAPGLEQWNFTKIADEGLGDGLNAYAHSMAWFKDRLYVGTTRANLCMVKAAAQTVDLSFWPVNCPDDIYELDRRAEIWRFEPEIREWELVHRAPWVEQDGAAKVPRDIGYRCMTVFNSSTCGGPALFVNAWAPSLAHQAPSILCSVDGNRFDPLPRVGAASDLNTYRILHAHDGRLYTSPTGRSTGLHDGKFQSEANVSGYAGPVRIERPARPGVDDGEPRRFRRPIEYDDIRDGVVCWTFVCRHTELRTRHADLEGAHRSRLSLPVEAGRGRWRRTRQSQQIGGQYVCLCRRTLRRYRHPARRLRPGQPGRTGGSEIIRIYPDDSWDLVIGQSQVTRDGSKRCISGIGAGFNNFFNGYMWRMAVHDGWLYVATYNSCAFLPYLRDEHWPQSLRDKIARLGREKVVADFGGFHLWRTRDGTRWSPVTINGFGNRYNYGGRTLVSTPSGLFVGTANPFGPEIALETTSGWRYVPNPRGGMEIWLGSVDTAGESATPARFGTPFFDLTRSDLLARFQPSYDETVVAEDRRQFGDFIDEFYAGSHFFNAGMWESTIRTPPDACARLMEYLLAPALGRTGGILDVGCGTGGTTRYLTRYWAPDTITGINISERQLVAARDFAPQCNFVNMDAARMRFEDASYAVVVCVQAAFQFNSRQAFLQEAWRVLEPGGVLVLADLAFPRASDDLRLGHHPANAISGRLSYWQMLARAGFDVLMLEDATEQCWQPYVVYSRRFARRKLRQGRATTAGLRVLEMDREPIERNAPRYILAAARKPAG